MNYSSIKLIYLSSITLVDDIKLISVCLFLVIIINISSINGIVINDNEFKITYGIIMLNININKNLIEIFILDVIWLFLELHIVVLVM